MVLQWAQSEVSRRISRLNLSQNFSFRLANKLAVESGWRNKLRLSYLLWEHFSKASELWLELDVCILRILSRCLVCSGVAIWNTERLFDNFRAHSSFFDSQRVWLHRSKDLSLIANLELLSKHSLTYHLRIFTLSGGSLLGEKFLEVILQMHDGFLGGGLSGEELLLLSFEIEESL